MGTYRGEVGEDWHLLRGRRARLERVERARRRVDVLVEAELGAHPSVCGTGLRATLQPFSTCASLKGRRHFAETPALAPAASTRTRRSSGVASTTSTSASWARTATSRGSSAAPARTVAPFGAATRKVLPTRDAAGAPVRASDHFWHRARVLDGPQLLDQVGLLARVDVVLRRAVLHGAGAHVTVRFFVGGV